MMENGMEFVRKHVILLALVLAAGGSSPAGAIPLAPTGYTATPGEGIAQGGLYNYFDETGSQLIDGIYGANDWSADLGNGPAYEWVAWKVADPVITFQFSGPVIVNQVGIDFNRSDPDGIVLPNMVTVGGTDFTVAPDAIPNASRGTVDFDGTWSGTTLTIDMTHGAPNQWIFVDEITFNGIVVPEPPVFMLLAGGLGCLALRLRRTLKPA
ncbi:MAG: hypothetical protein WAO02_18305 [Verrucomicrobiia bacterium]